MTKKNLTDMSRTHSWQGWEHQRKLWPGGPLAKGSEKCRFGSAALGSALVLLACLLGASWHLRRKATKESRSQGSSKSYVPTEREPKESKEADAAQPAGFSVLDLGPRVVCVVLSVLRTARKPFDALAGRRDRHLTRCAFPIYLYEYLYMPSHPIWLSVDAAVQRLRLCLVASAHV